MTGTYETTKRRKRKVLRLLGILTLGNMIFGGHHCHCHHHHHGRSLLLGTLLGLLISRANQTRTEEEV